MKILLGIGNPGARYHGTRHNVGFAVIDQLAARWSVTAWQQRFDAELALCRVRSSAEDDRVLLVKPTTFVNASGACAQAVLAFYQIPPSDLLVIVDDLNLALGDLRLRPSGSAGGHNGLRDIEARIGQAYPRLRLGIGKPPSPERQVDFVLTAFAAEEAADAALLLGKAVDCCVQWLEQGVEIACRFNGPLRPPAPKQKQKPPAQSAPTASMEVP